MADPTRAPGRHLDDVGWVLWAGTIGLESSIPARIEAALAGGFSRVSIGPVDVARREAEGASVHDLGRSLRDAGVDVVMDPVTGWCEDEPLPGPFSSVGVDDALRMCAALPVAAMTVIGPFSAEALRIDELARAFGAVCDRAADLGMQVQLEFMPMSAVTDVATAWAIVGGADRENGGIVFDTWHFFRGSPDSSALRRVPGSRIFAVQVADADAELQGDLGEDTFHRRLPGDGALDLVGVMRTLDEMGALRWVGPEVISPATAAMAPADAGRLTGSRVRALIDRARGGDHGRR
jgi:sugar phosphate isomerase/epimerase